MTEIIVDLKDEQRIYPRDFYFHINDEVIKKLASILFISILEAAKNK